MTKLLLRGYSLIELLIALAVGSILLLGVGYSYTAIKTTLLENERLENAQEVLRSASALMRRSLKQLSDENAMPTLSVVDGSQVLTVEHNTQVPKLSIQACNGTVQDTQFQERYIIRQIEPNLFDLICNIDGADITLLTGIEHMEFLGVDASRLFKMVIKPVGLPPYLIETDADGNVLTNGISVQIALSGVIMAEKSSKL